ncbi:hypothetical protein HJ588_11750 [Flexivirga sp. ID2601S]|uniref:Lipoprotein n=1 Tax=Flexivirga aerilata TaxID=1656889 RepID=A0A849ANM8_9MICO|nr:MULTISPECIES: hypothetical protein [Flexivirga]NNG39940.1 hypothetical protein [Flexivirga aerilata]
MTKAMRMAGATLAMGSVLLASACGSSDGGKAPSTTATPSPGTKSSTTPPKPASSSTTTSADPLAKKKAAATAAVVAFWKKVDVLETNPKGDLTSLDLVARGQQLAQWQYNIGAERQRGETGEGSFRVLHPVASSTTDPATYRVNACLDGTNFHLVKKSGKPVSRPSGAPHRVEYRYGVTQDPKTFKWYVTTEKVLGKC